jgi:hypothetical protein
MRAPKYFVSNNTRKGHPNMVGWSLTNPYIGHQEEPKKSSPLWSTLSRDADYIIKHKIDNGTYHY